MLILRGKFYYYRFWFNGKLYKGTTKKTDKAEATAIEKEIKKRIKDEQSGEKIVQSLQQKLAKKKIPGIIEVQRNTLQERFKANMSSTVKGS